jgi:hypothetical protein
MNAVSADLIQDRFSSAPVLDPGDPATSTLEVTRLPAGAATEEARRHFVGSARIQRM